MQIVMATFTPGMLYIVAGKSESTQHSEIGIPPTASEQVQVITAVLQKHAYRTRFILANQRRVFVATFQ